jgi:ATP-dependent protease ClpP protease subunit
MELPILLPDSKPETVWDLSVPIVFDNEFYNVFFTDNIQEPFVYNEIRYRLSKATDEDKFKFWITTQGGSLDSAISLLYAMRTTKASIHGILSGEVASAGTIITLGCDTIEIAPHTSFMVHYYSASVNGKGNEIKQQQAFIEKLLENMMYKVYQGFLTVEEIEHTIEGKDYWFNAEETITRFNNLKEHLNATST